VLVLGKRISAGIPRKVSSQEPTPPTTSVLFAGVRKDWWVSKQETDEPADSQIPQHARPGSPRILVIFHNYRHESWLVDLARPKHAPVRGQMKETTQPSTFHCSDKGEQVGKNGVMGFQKREPSARSRRSKHLSWPRRMLPVHTSSSVWAHYSPQRGPSLAFLTFVNLAPLE
jgi:hypothetical protein